MNPDPDAQKHTRIRIRNTGSGFRGWLASLLQRFYKEGRMNFRLLENGWLVYWLLQRFCKEGRLIFRLLEDGWLVYCRGSNVPASRAIWLSGF
jgi:hypothetical protein